MYYDWTSGRAVRNVDTSSIKMRMLWRQKRAEICIELAFHESIHSPLTALLLAPTLSAGEYKVSGGNRPASQSTRSSLEA